MLSGTNRDGAVNISSYAYTMDSASNRTQVVDGSGTTTLSYDSLYRLTGVTYPNADTQSYTYDAMGNRLTKVHNGATTNYTYDDADQMTAAGGVSYTYDANGNQTGYGANTFAWDADNRLTSATIGGTSSSYTYNGAGLRATRTIAGVAVTYTWDLTAGLPVVLQDSAANKYVYGHDLISQTDSGGSQTYFLTDGLGSTTAVTDFTGAVTGTQTYDVFGATRTQTGTTTEWSYTGEQNHPTGLEYLRARYYDNNTGRFISRDSMPFLQRYGYANNNPATFTDPSGHVSASSVGNGAKNAGQTVYDIAKQILADPCWKLGCGHHI